MAEAKISKNQSNLSIFATRCADSNAFTWEIRKFGGILIERGSESYSSAEMARQVGKAALMESIPQAFPADDLRDEFAEGNVPD